MSSKKNWVRVRCPTCRGKGTKGYTKTGDPRICPLCQGDKTVLVPPLNDKDHDL